jgi:excisionase family DNA binding protein
MSVEAMKMSRTLTVAEVAERPRVKPITVREYLRKGKIPGSRIGKSWLILDVDLERFLSSTPEEPKPSRHEEWLALSPEEKARRVDAVMGKYKDPSWTLDDFLREKHAEVEEEERRWDERHKADLARKQENDAA